MTWLSMATVISACAAPIDETVANAYNNDSAPHVSEPKKRAREPIMKWIDAEVKSGIVPASGDNKPVAVAMVIHGLNLNPSAMVPIAEVLTSQGFDVLLVTLSGHDVETMTDSQRLEDFKRVSYSLWREEVEVAYKELDERARLLSVNKVFVGYSIGALLGVDLLLGERSTHTKEHSYFKKMVLLAPAVAVRPTSHLLRPFSWWPDLVMPSFSPRDYHSNWGTPMAAYNGLYDAMTHFDKQVSGVVNIPSLVIVDKGDELVSPEGIEDLKQAYQLSEWQIRYIKKSSDAKTWYHHLILDEWCLGKSAWSELTSLVTGFLEDSE